MKDLVIKNLVFSYPGDFLAVDDISMEIKAGENVAIVGQNGAGKSTTVKLMNGLLKPTKGDVIVGDMNTKDYTTAQIARHVGYVFQNPDDQIFNATVEQEVAYGPKYMKLDPEEEKRRVEFALKVTGMDEFKDENPMNLPLSTRKFVTIAAVIAMDTDIMIFDEPTAGQDIEGNKRLGEILKVLHEMGKTVITISHDMEFVVENFERVIVMAKRKIVREGTPEEIFWDLETLKYAMLHQPYVSRVCRKLGIKKQVVHMDDAVDEILKLKK